MLSWRVDECKPLVSGTYAFTPHAIQFAAPVSIAIEYDEAAAQVAGRGLHSSTPRLNVSTFCGIRWVHDFHPVY